MNRRGEYEARLLTVLIELGTELRRERRILERLEHFLESLEVRAFQISQQGGGTVGQINGVVVGGTGNFAAAIIPTGGVLPPGPVPQWSTTNALVTLTPSTDGLSCAAAVDPTASVGKAFDLTVSVMRTDGVVASGTAEVPFLAVPPPPNEVTGFDISQTS